LWSLLPESIYGVDYRSTNLSQLGPELYGRVRLGGKRGELTYSAYYGYYTYASNDGTLETLREEGLTFSKRPGGITPGFDLRWKTPVKGLTVGGSLMLYDAKGTLTDGTYREPLTYWPTYYAQYDRKNLFLSAEYVSLAQYTDVGIGGQTPSSSLSNTRAWFAMAGYHLTDKLQAGAYYTRYVVVGADQTDPVNYFRDWVASSRYDFNSHFYLKLEGHFMDGNAVGFYGIDNPNGLKPQTKLVVAKVGFYF
jgi:hypothetical protein